MPYLRKSLFFPIKIGQICSLPGNLGGSGRNCDVAGAHAQLQGSTVGVGEGEGCIGTGALPVDGNNLAAAGEIAAAAALQLGNMVGIAGSHLILDGGDDDDDEGGLEG